MMRPSGVLVVFAAAALNGCAASTQEIETARSARYTCGFQQMFEAANEAMEEVFYRVGWAQAESGIVRSERRWYEESGAARKRGAAMVADEDVLVLAEVRLVKHGSAYTVSTAADVIENLHGSPQGRRLAPDDPDRPAWVQGKLDRMTVIIHDRLQGCAQASAAR
jgi:hypothetical protein